MNANTSYVVLDPKGEILRDTGNLLLHEGYDIKVLDLINMDRSHCYNPFVYLRNDNDIQRLVTNLFKNTTPKGAQSQDPFWDQAATMLLLALIFYLHYEAPPEEQNFPMVMEMIRAGDVKEDDEGYKSTLDLLFERLEMRNPEHIALKYYRSYHSGSGKTLKSIQITLISRLEKFNLESLAGITQNDEMELATLGEKKTAVFAVIPDNDSSFNFLVGMLYGRYVSSYDVQLLNSFILDSESSCSDEWKRYISTVIATVCGTDAEVSESLLSTYDFTRTNVNQALDELIQMPAFIRRGAEASSTHILKYARNKRWSEINHRIWSAQVQTLFPLIELERIELISKYQEEIQEALDQEATYQYGEELTDPIEVELGTMCYLMARRRSDYLYSLYIPDESDRERIHFLHECRNRLAHAETCTVEQVSALLEK